MKIRDQKQKKSEILSCRLNRLLSATFEVFFNLRYRNRVPKRLKVAMLYIRPNGKNSESDEIGPFYA